jgi:hypothetical protein
MSIIHAFRDFAGGLSRGLSLYFTERNDFIERTVLPAATERPRKQR